MCACFMFVDLLLQFVFIHDEVYNSAKEELSNVLRSLLEKVFDHLLSTVSMIDHFSENGALQVLIEVEFIANTLNKYLSVNDDTYFVYKKIVKLLKSFITAQEKQLLEQRKKQLMMNTQRSTYIMFSCFRDSHW